MIVKDLMTTSVTWVKSGSPAAAAVNIMRAEEVGIVPVCDVQGHLLGVVTDRDILMRCGLAGGGKVRTVDDIMSRNIVCAAPKDNIHDAALKMSEFGVRRLPVVENEKLAGMLSLKDLASKRIFTAEIGHIIYNVCNKKP